MKRYCRSVQRVAGHSLEKGNWNYNEIYNELAEMFDRKYLQNIDFKTDEEGSKLEVVYGQVERICDKDEFLYGYMELHAGDTTYLCRELSKDNKEDVLGMFGRNADIVARLGKLLAEPECELDILNDIYLNLKYELDEMKLLFVDGKLSELDSKMKTTINNLKNPNKKNPNKKKPTIIFDISELTSTAKKTKMRDFGIGVVKLWLASKNFKRLFNITETSKKKYCIEQISELLKEFEIQYEQDDIIILEKLLGLNTEAYFIEKIATKCQNDGESIQQLLKKIMLCSCPFIRCRIIEIVGDGLDTQKKIGKEYLVRQKIKEITIILEYFIQGLENAYSELLNGIWVDLRKEYPAVNDCMDWVLKERDNVLQKLMVEKCKEIEEAKKLGNSSLNCILNQGINLPKDEIEIAKIKEKMNKKQKLVVDKAIEAMKLIALDAVIVETDDEKEGEEKERQYQEKSQKGLSGRLSLEYELKYRYLVNRIEEEVKYGTGIDSYSLENDIGKIIIERLTIKSQV